MGRFLIAFLCVLSMSALATAQQDDCFPRLVRLLIGDRYANSSSPFSATLMYQTYKECPQSGIVFRGVSHQVSVQPSVHSDWDAEFCHNKKKCEQVVYNQYIHVIKVAVEPLQEFTYAFCTDSAAKTGCTIDYTSKMPVLSYPAKMSLRTNFLSKSKPQQEIAAPLKLLFFGDNDLSTSGKITVDAIYKYLETNKCDAFLFLGDYGYEFYQNNGEVGDSYVDALTKINTAAPMAITAGNHEDNYDFSFFNQKFQMPFFNENQNNYYSFSIGNTHFISLNLHYFNDQVNPPVPENQKKMLDWVENDLKNIDRTLTPWVIVFGHKMIYCKGSDCETFASDYAAFDTLLNKYNVDLFVSGHKHKFIAMKPMNNAQVAQYTISKKNIISDYKGFVTIVEGNGGTSKLDEDNLADSARNLKQSEVVFDKKQQKAAMLTELTNLGFGVLEITDNNNLKISSIDSTTLESVYDLGLKK